MSRIQKMAFSFLRYSKRVFFAILKKSFCDTQKEYRKKNIAKRNGKTYFIQNAMCFTFSFCDVLFEKELMVAGQQNVT